jgi:hypothetical protein
MQILSLPHVLPSSSTVTMWMLRSGDACLLLLDRIGVIPHCQLRVHVDGQGLAEVKVHLIPRFSYVARLASLVLNKMVREEAVEECCRTA